MGDSVTLQQSYKFVTIGRARVVFFLSFDVADDARGLRRTHAECAEPTLPRELRSIRKGLMYPGRRRALDLANRLGQRAGRRHAGQQVDVVFHAVSRDELSVQLAKDPAQIGEQAFLQRGIDLCPPILRGKDDVDPE